MYGGVGVSALFLHRGSTDSPIGRAGASPPSLPTGTNFLNRPAVSPYRNATRVSIGSYRFSI